MVPKVLKVRATLLVVASWLLFAVLATVSGQVPGVDLRITDSRGTEVVVRDAAIDYSGMLSSDKETQGIRVLQGDGLVMLKWADVDTVRVTKKDESVKPARVELEVTLRSSKKVAAALSRQGKMKLVGKSDLGEYSIDLDRIRAIAPVR
jgi:sporulation protein YlmC with PRC-barrel domain